MNDGSWLTYTEAGQRLGISSEAVRLRLRRGSLKGTRGNDGTPRVWVDGDAVARPVASRSFTTGRLAADQSGEMVPASVMTEMLDRQKAVYEDMLVRAEGQSAALRADMETERLRHAAELTRLTHAHRAGVNALMNRVAALLVERRERRPWWRW